MRTRKQLAILLVVLLVLSLFSLRDPLLRGLVPVENWLYTFMGGPGVLVMSLVLSTLLVVSGFFLLREVLIRPRFFALLALAGVALYLVVRTPPHPLFSAFILLLVLGALGAVASPERAAAALDRLGLATNGRSSGGAGGENLPPEVAGRVVQGMLDASRRCLGEEWDLAVLVPVLGGWGWSVLSRSAPPGATPLLFAAGGPEERALKGAREVIVPGSSEGGRALVCLPVSGAGESPCAVLRASSPGVRMGSEEGAVLAALGQTLREPLQSGALARAGGTAAPG